MKYGFEWIKANTPRDSIVLGEGIEPYAAYYAERRYEMLPYKDLPEKKGV